MIKLDSFERAFFGCALWSSTDESNEQGGEPLDKNYSISDIAEETILKLKADCDSFREMNAELLEQAGDSEQNGHDFWLTRNRHGAGFWDRGYSKAVGNGLTESAHVFGEVNLLVHDGKVYC